MTGRFLYNPLTFLTSLFPSRPLPPPHSLSTFPPLSSPPSLLPLSLFPLSFSTCFPSLLLSSHQPPSVSFLSPPHSLTDWRKVLSLLSGHAEHDFEGAPGISPRGAEGSSGRRPFTHQFSLPELCSSPQQVQRSPTAGSTFSYPF